MTANALYIILLLIFVGGALISSQTASKSITYLLIWTFAIVALVFGYNQYEKLRFAPRIEDGNYTITVPIHRVQNGFVIKAKFNGKEREALIDTGATAIVLSYEDAIAAGIDVKSLSFDQAVSTANGMTYHANTRLNLLQVGDRDILVDSNVLVAAEGDLDMTLLGMTFLRKASSYEVTNDLMRLNF